MLGDGSLDVAFALEIEPPSGVERLVLSSEELAIATAPGHELSGEGPLPVSELDGHRLIAFGTGSSSRQLVDTALARAGVRPRIAVEANDLALVRALAASFIGINGSLPLMLALQEMPLRTVDGRLLGQSYGSEAHQEQGQQKSTDRLRDTPGVR